MSMFAMTSWQTALVSIVGLLIGAGVAIAGAVCKEPTLTNLGSTIIGGALGVFIPTTTASTTRRLTSPMGVSAAPPK